MEYKTQFHPCSNTPSLFQSQEEFGQCATATMAPDPHPWCPFIKEGDYLFAEIALQVGLNVSQINGLLSLISCIVQGKANFTRHNMTAPYKGENLTFPVYACSLWEWALDLLLNPLLASHFIWDAQWYERFYSEPWTGDRWWDIQGYPVIARCGNLPMNIRNGECFGGGCVISWLPIVPESAKEEGKTGYTNYKHVIWHEAFLCIIDRLAKLSKLGYKYECYEKITQWLFPLILILSADYEEQCMMSLIRGTKSKHPCPVCLVPLEDLSQLAKSFPTCTIRQAKEALTIYQEKKSASEPILKALGLWPVANIFWKVENSEPEEAVSFDCLHALHDGLFGHHLLEELKILLSKLPCKYAAQLEEQLAAFPSWQGLAHFNGILHVSYADGNKLQDLARQTFYAALNILTNDISCEGYQLLQMLRSYLELDSLIGLDVHTDKTLELIEREQLVFGSELKLAEHLKTDWNFPKVHLWKHVMWDIWNKGAAHNYSTRPNKKMHSSLKDAYQDCSNGKDIAIQVLHVDHHHLAMKLIRNQVDAEANHTQQDHDDDDIDSGGDEDVLMSFSEHVKLGSLQSLKSIQSIIHDHASQQEFQGFHQKFTWFINQCLPIYLNRNQNSWKNISFAKMFQLQEHAYLKVNYKSRMDWWQATNYLWCNPSFHGKPRYDTVLFQLLHSEIAFAHLVFMFSCNIPDFSTYQFALICPYTANINVARSSFDNAFRLAHIKAHPHTVSIFIPIQSIVRGALLYPDPKYKDKYFVVEHIDGDMFCHVNKWNGHHLDQE
ncbi:hypothetical protein F5J12DRAFT_907606 [Pisolithus orientalis]|uniref:uncharacterized protein n=1 Tax=Pisolithus orientalis TaxID=936130 RepID=UPI00222467B9|nr:uncharacterized protein F5J12DRAFT_907606 [Pisolithus orientalis]KAI5990052.1 hypothetical protein F5J12DRAFT_907606 [Pisolithus orientalis]